MTTEQTEQDVWVGIGTRVGVTDRAAAEAGVRAAYRQAGLPEPRALVWCASPLVGTAAALLLTTGAEGLTGPEARWAVPEARRLLAAQDVRADRPAGAVSVKEAVRVRPWRQARERLVARLGREAWSERWTVASGQSWPRLDALAGQIRVAVADGLAGRGAASEGARPAVGLALFDAVPGQQDAVRLAGLADDPGLAGPVAMARSSGWWWPYAEVAVLADLPVVLDRDATGRLHGVDGPALAYGDGFALHAWRGTAVPRSLFERLGALTVEDVRAAPNAEQRRVLLEHFGPGRYLAASEEAQLVHQDGTGVLWRLELPDDEPLVVVEVTDPVPEPDGTRRVRWLRVPPSTRSAREGVAWTFGMPAEAYRPKYET
ncbi:hypothetical protein ABH931_002298 [Streptacidiphilus sp. MAP12-33]|uniref:DUF6745 domain-containing protein n=1 Tax=Streptacidiphilus sp. MAP12-33 TaxID=3156266 RepID=UPI003512B033